MIVRLEPMNDHGKKAICQMIAEKRGIIAKMFGKVIKSESGVNIEIKLPPRFFGALKSMVPGIAKEQIKDSLYKEYHKAYGVLRTDISIVVEL